MHGAGAGARNLNYGSTALVLTFPTPGTPVLKDIGLRIPRLRLCYSSKWWSLFFVHLRLKSKHFGIPSEVPQLFTG